MNIISVSGGDHQHTILVTPGEIAAGVDITVLSSATLGHAHFVRITAADFVALNAGMIVRKKSCADVDHEWVLGCNGAGATANPPMCSDECGDGTTPTNAGT